MKVDYTSYYFEHNIDNIREHNDRPILETVQHCIIVKNWSICQGLDKDKEKPYYLQEVG